MTLDQELEAFEKAVTEQRLGFFLRRSESYDYGQRKDEGFYHMPYDHPWTNGAWNGWCLARRGAVNRTKLCPT